MDDSSLCNSEVNINDLDFVTQNIDDDGNNLPTPLIQPTWDFAEQDVPSQSSVESAGKSSPVELTTSNILLDVLDMGIHKFYKFIPLWTIILLIIAYGLSCR